MKRQKWPVEIQIFNWKLRLSICKLFSSCNTFLLFILFPVSKKCNSSFLDVTCVNWQETFKWKSEKNIYQNYFVASHSFNYIYLLVSDASNVAQTAYNNSIIVHISLFNFMKFLKKKSAYIQMRVFKYKEKKSDSERRLKPIPMPFETSEKMNRILAMF